MILRASATTQRCGSWRDVPSPPLPSIVELASVSIYARSDAWAVGVNSSFVVPTIYPLDLGIIEHWDGTRWSIIPSPQPGNYENFLYGVATLSRSNVWAVGTQDNAKNGFVQPQLTLIEHWDGTRWSVVPSPNAKAFFNTLSGMAALAPNNIWAVGSQSALSGTGQTLIEHWDGTSWSIVPSPNVGSFDNILEGVNALAPDNIWTVGEDSNNGVYRTLVEHWNGLQWSVVPSPTVGTYANYLRKISEIAPDDIWTVGLFWSYPGDITNTLTEHWNGSTWSVVASPNPPGGDNVLGGVASVASNNVWATGYSSGDALILHWDGQQWQQVAIPRTVGGLASAEALNAHDIWAVGMQIMHYC